MPRFRLRHCTDAHLKNNISVYNFHADTFPPNTESINRDKCNINRIMNEISTRIPNISYFLEKGFAKTQKKFMMSTNVLSNIKACSQSVCSFKFRELAPNRRVSKKVDEKLMKSYHILILKKAERNICNLEIINELNIDHKRILNDLLSNFWCRVNYQWNIWLFGMDQKEEVIIKKRWTNHYTRFQT